MKKGIIVLMVIVAIIIIAILSLIGKYNEMVGQKENVDKQLSNLDVNLQRRGDLIPNLVNTVKGYASHEIEAIDSVTDARAKLSGATTIEEKSEANNELTSSLNRLLMIVENYPDLKANENFKELSYELSGTENRISTARRDYNEAVQIYNLLIKKFPNNIVADMFGFNEEKYFEADEGSKEVPNVSFD